MGPRRAGVWRAVPGHPNRSGLLEPPASGRGSRAWRACRRPSFRFRATPSGRACRTARRAARPLQDGEQPYGSDSTSRRCSSRGAARRSASTLRRVGQRPDACAVPSTCRAGDTASWWTPPGTSPSMPEPPCGPTALIRPSCATGTRTRVVAQPRSTPSRSWSRPRAPPCTSSRPHAARCRTPLQPVFGRRLPAAKWGLGFFHRMRSLATAGEALAEAGEFVAPGSRSTCSARTGVAEPVVPLYVRVDRSRFRILPASSVHSGVGASGSTCGSTLRLSRVAIYAELKGRSGSIPLDRIVPTMPWPTRGPSSRASSAASTSTWRERLQVDEVDGYDRWLWPDMRRSIAAERRADRQCSGCTSSEHGRSSVARAADLGSHARTNAGAPALPFVIYNDSYSTRSSSQRSPAAASSRALDAGGALIGVGRGVAAAACSRSASRRWPC